jgi:predicted Zn-dependent protease
MKPFLMLLTFVLFACCLLSASGCHHAGSEAPPDYEKPFDRSAIKSSVPPLKEAYKLVHPGMTTQEAVQATRGTTVAHVFTRDSKGSPVEELHVRVLKGTLILTIKGDRVLSARSPEIEAEEFRKRPVRKQVIYFAPIGAMPGKWVSELALYFRTYANYPVQVLPAMRIEKRMRDEKRRQLIAEEVIAAMERRYAKQLRQKNTDSYLIGITDNDLYTRRQDWQSAFFARSGRTGIVSSARMDPRFFGRPANATLTKTRLQQMVRRYLGRPPVPRFRQRSPQRPL